MVVVDPKIMVKTERLLLRPLVIEDAEDVLLLRKNLEVMKHTSLLASASISDTQAWIHGCHTVPENWNFSIELRSPHNGPRVIGLIGAVRTPEIGYMLNKSYWGQGYATEALRAFMPLFFEQYSGTELASYKPAGDIDQDGKSDEGAGGEYARRYEYAEALTDTELVVSQNVLTKVGFKLFEKREKDFENPVLGIRDTLVYRMYRPASEEGHA